VKSKLTSNRNGKGSDEVHAGKQSTQVQPRSDRSEASLQLYARELIGRIVRPVLPAFGVNGLSVWIWRKNWHFSCLFKTMREDLFYHHINGEWDMDGLIVGAQEFEQPFGCAIVDAGSAQNAQYKVMI
jgi:hypothetical protein